MNQIDKTRENIRLLKKESIDLKQKHKQISGLMHFPIIKSFIDNLIIFEKSEYLFIIKHRNLSKLLRKVSELVDQAIEHRQSLGIFLENSQFFLMGQEIEILEEIEEEKKDILNVKNIYEIFLNKLYFERNIEFYKYLLKEKIKCKRQKIRNLNTEIISKMKDKDVDQFIFFLRNYIPIHGKIKNISMRKTKKTMSGIGIPKHLILIKPNQIEKIDEIIKKKQKIFDRVNFSFRNKQEMVDFYNFLKLVVYSLGLKKKYELQKIFIAEFFLMRAKKYFSVLYENNTKKFSKIKGDFENSKKENKKIKNKIKKFKMEIINNLNF